MMYCSICGDEIAKEEERFYLEDGKIVCSECYNEKAIVNNEREKKS